MKIQFQRLDRTPSELLKHLALCLCSLYQFRGIVIFPNEILMMHIQHGKINAFYFFYFCEAGEFKKAYSSKISGT